MKIRFTNGNGDEADINIKGKCKITDYDTRKKLPDGKDLTVEVDGENVSIMNGTELKQDSQTVEMNANKYSIFTAIAGMDGDSGNLTEKDIAKAKKVFKDGGENSDKLLELGVTGIRYDSHAGVATIVIGEKELLRIDFQTRKERIGRESDSSNLYDIESDLSLLENSMPENTYDNTRMREVLDENGKPIREIINKPYESYLKALAHRESRGIVDKKNRAGYIGLYQIGEQALADIGIYSKKSKNYNNDWTGTFKKNPYGITSLSDFRNSAQKQNLVLQDLMKKNWSYIKSYGLDKYIGQEINGQAITESGLLAGAHLGGIGKLKQYIESHGKVDKKDGNGVRVSVYVGEFAHFDMSEITGSPNKVMAMKKEQDETPKDNTVVKQSTDTPYIPFGIYKPNHDFKVMGPIMPPAGNIEYTIEAGDSLSKIAKRFNTTVDKIKKANNMKNDNIVAGKKLIIPLPEQKQI